MAAYGIDTRNPDGHVMISSDAQSFHYLGTANYSRVTFTGLTDFPNFAGDTNTLSGRHIHLYTISVPNGSDPLVFIQPGNSLSYGVLRKYNSSGNVWAIEIIQRGPNAVAPRNVVCFYQLIGVKEPAEDYGMITRIPNGDIAFDAARKPLAIVDIANVIPPTIPCDGGEPIANGGYRFRDKILDHNFKCDNTSNAYDLQNVDANKLAFTAPALAQAVYNRTKYGYKKSCGTYSCQSHWSTTSWWCMYHQTFSLVGTGTTLKFHAGWAPFAAGYHYWERYEDGGIGGGSGGGYSAGDQPYVAKTINHAYNTAIFIDAESYFG